MTQRTPKIALVRHAATASGKAGRLLGWLDDPLSEEGRREATGLAGTLAATPAWAGGEGVVVSSDLQRAVETAEAISCKLSWPRVVLAELRERNFGHWAGKSLGQLGALYPGEVERFVRDPLSVDPPGAESRGAFRARVASGWRAVELLARTGPAVVVAHDGPIRVLMARRWQSPRPPGLYEITTDVIYWMLSDSALHETR